MHRYLLTLAIILTTSHQLNVGIPPCDDYKFAQGIKDDVRLRPPVILPNYTPLILVKNGCLPQMVTAASTNNTRLLKRSLDVLSNTVILEEIKRFTTHQPGLSFEQHRRASMG